MSHRTTGDGRPETESEEEENFSAVEFFPCQPGVFTNSGIVLSGKISMEKKVDIAALEVLANKRQLNEKVNFVTL